MKAVVMAGGEGTRLRPLTVSRPKPMMPICNRPVMEYVIELLKRAGVDTVIVTLHYLAEDVVSYFGDGSDFGIKIVYSIEEEALGTAGSVKKVEEYLDDTFLVISGDGLTDLDLARAIAFHKENNAVATLTLARVDTPLEYGVVITDSENRIERFVEKPSWGEVFSDQVNTGIYVLEPEILKMMDHDRVYDFSGDIFPRLLAEKKGLFGYVASGYWCDVGDIEHYRMAHRDMFSGRVLHEMVGHQRDQGIWIGQGTKIDPTAKLEGPLMIGKNCRIGAGAVIGKYTCIGDNCIVEDGVTMHRDILFNNVFVGRKSRTSGTIVGRQSTIKSAVTLSDGVVLGENVFVGQGALIFPQLKVWPDKHVEDGATVSMNLVWGMLASGTLFGQNGVLGLGNIEITPEFAMKLGAAFGSLLPKGSVVSTSRDAHPATRLTNRALISGLSSVGINVLDLRQNPAPISRYAVCNGDPIAGVHTRVHCDDPRSIEMEFFDQHGINIEKGVERKVENSFVRQDFRRTYLDEVGVISFSDGTLNDYVSGFTSHLDIDAIRRANFKVVIDYSYGNSSVVLPTILGKLGAETVSLNAYMDPVKARQVHEDHAKAVQQLSDIVGPLGANLGILMDVDAERLSVVDEKGQIIEGNSLLALMVLMVLRREKEALIAVPISAPHILEKLAEQYGGKIVRTKTDARSVMHTASVGQARISLAGTPNGSFIFPGFSPGFDAMFAFAKLLEMMASEKQTLSELNKGIPPHYSAFGEVECSWAAKAKVMRLIVEEYRDFPLEMLDGIRVEVKDGAVLIIPDPALAKLNIWVEGTNKERAEEILAKAKRVVIRLENIDEDKLRRKRKIGAEVALGVSQTLPEERAFHFWIAGRYLGIQARSLRTFVDVIHYVEVASLEYHMARNDFAIWLESEVGRPVIAEEIRQITTSGVKGEQLRRKLLEVFGETSE